jgi:hypothetical protein
MEGSYVTFTLHLPTQGSAAPTHIVPLTTVYRSTDRPRPKPHQVPLFFADPHSPLLAPFSTEPPPVTVPGLLSPSTPASVAIRIASERGEKGVERRRRVALGEERPATRLGQ